MDILNASATSLIESYARGSLSPVTVMQQVLEQGRHVQDKLNAFCRIDEVNALMGAEIAERVWRTGYPPRPLEGVPVSIKDTAMVSGWPLGRGSRVNEGKAPMNEDAPAVARLRAAGAVLFASTTTCENGWKAVTDSPVTGITRNPYDPTLTPGGSSGGAAVAVATGCGPLALGSDGGGSIRVPAGFCGLVGLKPTFGYVPQYPMGLHYGDMAHYGPLARTVDDLKLMLDVVGGYSVQDPYSFWAARKAPAGCVRKIPLAGLRIAATCDFGFMNVDAEICEAFAHVIRLLRVAGVTVVDVPPMEDWRPTYRPLWMAGAWESYRHVPDDCKDLVDPELRAWAVRGKDISLDTYNAAPQARLQYRLLSAQLDDEVDCVLSPTNALLPFRAGYTLPDDGCVDWLEWAGLALLYNLTGQPALSIPAARSRQGLPIGLQIASACGHDEKVLEIGKAIAALLGPVSSLPTSLLSPKAATLHTVG